MKTSGIYFQVNPVLPAEGLFSLTAELIQRFWGARDCIGLVERYDTQTEKDKWYERASLHAFRALAWTEVGFEGLDNLAKSDASRNWTSAVGHVVTEEEREEKIKTSGREMYENCLRLFTTYRTNARITSDHFTEYETEHLLEIYK